MNRTISPDAWKSLSQSLMVEEAALHAVAAVESSGSGFLAPPSDLPKVLFEGHAFHRLTQGRFDDVEPTLSFPKWTKEHYAGSALGEWKRLERAKELDRAAALQSASWGMFQIMGFNYAIWAFPTWKPSPMPSARRRRPTRASPGSSRAIAFWMRSARTIGRNLRRATTGPLTPRTSTTQSSRRRSPRSASR